MTWRRSLLGGTVAAVLLAGVVFGGGQWLGAVFGGRLQAGGIAPEDMSAWLDNALAAVIAETGRGARAADWEPIQVEECGTTAIAFYAERDTEGNRAYRWAVGEPARLRVVAAGGLAGTLGSIEVAALRASLPVCSVLLSPGLGEAETREALLAASEARGAANLPARFAAPVPGPEVLAEAQITDMWPIERDRYSLMIAYRENEVARLDRLILSATDNGGFDILRAASDMGGASPLVVFRDPAFGVPTYFALTGGADVAAVDLIGPGVVVRYPVTGSGFMLEGDMAVDAVTEYRLLDPDGLVLRAGEIEVWCNEGDAFRIVLPGC